MSLLDPDPTVKSGPHDFGVPKVPSTTRISIRKGEVFSLEDVDPALNRKMHLVNNAIDDIGWTGYHWKLFVLNGFGYAVDSLILLLQSIVQPQVVKEMNPPFERGLTIALYVGLLLGAFFWGLSADIVGRRFAFNVSLFICSIFAIAAGAAPSYPILGLFVAISAFGAGGNLILDTTVFLEFLPSNKQYLLTLLAAWWGVGQTTAALVAWPFMANYSCESSIDCPKESNYGWRYVWFTCGTLVLVMSALRVTVIRLHETPKWLLAQGRDSEVVEILHELAKKSAGGRIDLTLGMLDACGEVKTGKSKTGKFSMGELMVHLRGLCATKKMTLSTVLVWFSWAMIGLAYPLYNVFLPEYLSTRGAKFGDGGVYQTYRDYAISNTCGIFGPILAGFLCEVPRVGRRGTMVIGAVITMAFLFAYTQVRSAAQNLAFTCMCYFWLNVYYGCLYAYTPEVLPSAHRATGNGIAVAFNRLMGIMAAVVATYADTSTPVPIYICAALYVALAAVAAAFPYEPYGRRSA